MNKSIWEEYLNNKKYNSVEENMETDVLVIGGGIAGILISRKLQDNNIRTILLEKDRIGLGNTCKTTAFLSVQHETLYQDLGPEKARVYLNLNKRALNEYKELSKKYDFDYEEVDSCLFSEDPEIIKNEYDCLKSLDEDVYLKENIPYEGHSTGICFRNQAIINPIKFINQVSAGLNIYENSEVIKLRSNYALLKNGRKVKFKWVVIATHYPMVNILNLQSLKLTQRKSYVVLVKNGYVDATYCSIDEDGMYYRMYKDYLLIGGNDKDTGTYCLSDFTNIVLNKFNLEEKDIIYSWCGQDTITLDGIPYIGKSSFLYPNHIIVTGFNLWGFTWAMASSNIVLNIIKDGIECNLTKPSRFFVNKNLFKNIKNSFVNLVNFRKPRCTHLGCGLVYNEKEGIYECPCHGSIYDRNGNLVEGPAKKDL